MGIHLRHHTSETAAGTIFGTLTVSLTITYVNELTWTEMEVSDKTFTSSELLGIAPLLGTAASAGIYDLMIRYKEK